MLGHDRQAPLPVGIGRPIRNRPRLQDAVCFQAKVVVQPSRGVLLHDERQWPTTNRRCDRWGRLSRAGKVALGAVLLEWAHTPLITQLTSSTTLLTPPTIIPSPPRRRRRALPSPQVCPCRLEVQWAWPYPSWLLPGSP